MSSKGKTWAIGGVVAILVVGLIFFFLPPDRLGVETHSYLQDFVADNKYEPFDIPRNRWGVGTVISFDDKGAENIVWMNSECLRLTTSVEPGDSPGDIASTDVTLASGSYWLGSQSSVELGLAKGISEDVELSGALDDSRVKGIKISVREPKEHVVSDGRLEQRIIQLTKDGEDCTDKIFEEGVVVIDRVLSVGGFGFAFMSDTETNLTLDGRLMGAIGLSAPLHSTYKGRAQLASDDLRMVGYRAYEMTIDPGLAEGGVESIRIDPAEFKAAARSRAAAGQ